MAAEDGRVLAQISDSIRHDLVNGSKDGQHGLVLEKPMELHFKKRSHNGAPFGFQHRTGFTERVIRRRLDLDCFVRVSRHRAPKILGAVAPNRTRDLEIRVEELVGSENDQRPVVENWGRHNRDVVERDQAVGRQSGDVERAAGE